jgi:hypothetical protein
MPSHRTGRRRRRTAARLAELARLRGAEVPAAGGVQHARELGRAAWASAAGVGPAREHGERARAAEVARRRRELGEERLEHGPELGELAARSSIISVRSG